MMLVQMTACQHWTWRTCQNQRLSPWPHADRDADQYSSDQIVEPIKDAAEHPLPSGDDVVQPVSPKAHALSAVRRHHVRIILRNLLAGSPPCRGLSEDASCDT